jgi:hypothetical protein
VCALRGKRGQFHKLELHREKSFREQPDFCPGLSDRVGPEAGSVKSRKRAIGLMRSRMSLTSSLICSCVMICEAFGRVV